MSRLACGLLLLCETVFAGTFDEQHAHLITRNPKELSLKITVDKNTYYLGETIPITLTFSNNSDREYYVQTRTYDRSGRLWDITFYVDGPIGGYSDPLDTYHPGLGGGLSRGPEHLGQYSQIFTLNEWVRFDIPGEYRIYCTTTRTWARTDSGRQTINLCSQIITIRINPPDERFIAKTMTEACRDLKSKDSRISCRSIRTLRFLATKDSTEALLPFLGGEDRSLHFEAFAGIIGARDWTHAKGILYDRMDEPNIPINSYYVRTLVHVSLPRQEHLITWDPNDVEASHRRYNDLQAKKKALEKKVLQRLAEVFREKKDRALAVTCSLLLERQIESSDLRQSLARSFLCLTEDEQVSLLKYQWQQIRCAEMASVLRRIVQAGPQHQEEMYPEIFSRALLCYKEFEPEKTRAIIIGDIKRPRPQLADEVLLSLPDESLPEIEDLLVQNLSARRGASSFKVSLLVERYATARVLPQVVKFYQKHKGRWACSIQARLLRYWVKHDRSKGLAAVVEAVGLRERTRCYTSALNDVLSAHYGPDAEEIALSFLEDREPDVVVNVVRLLGHKGTVNSVDSLLAKLASLDPDSKDQRLPGASYTDASVYHEIINCFLYSQRWQLSNAQKQLLTQHLRTDQERQIYERRSEDKQQVK